jgi:hypothetical protein
VPKPKKIPASVRRALAGAGVQIPQVAELVSHFMAAAGGALALAKMLLEEYLNAKPGSIIRQRILDSVLRMLNIANQAMGGSEEIDLVNDADLESELKRLMEQMPDGEEEAGPAEGAGANPGEPAGP